MMNTEKEILYNLYLHALALSRMNSEVALPKFSGDRNMTHIELETLALAAQNSKSGSTLTFVDFLHAIEKTVSSGAHRQVALN